MVDPLLQTQRGKPAASLQPACTPPQVWLEQVKKAPAGSSRKSWASRIASMHVLPHWATLVAQTVNCLPTTRETWVRSLGREDPLEKEMTAHSSTLT